MNSQNGMRAWGKLEIYLYFPTNGESHEAAITEATSILNRKTVCLLEGDIHTKDGKSYPIYADKCEFTWFDAVADDEL